MEYTRESILFASVRAFCKSFASVIGVLIGIVLICLGLIAFSSPDIYPAKSNLKLAPDAEGNRELLAYSTPAILRLDIKGVIGMGDLTADKVEQSLLDSREGMLVNDRVKAVLLYINSPGGTVDDANAIYRSLMSYKQKYKTPIFAFVDGLCASGGMYIASAADKIFATETSIIGSVGIILGPAFNFSGLMERYGVEVKTLTEGKDKDMLSPYRPWVPGEDASLRTITADLYAQFVSIVAGARPRLSKEKLINDYGARVYIAKTAEDYGYIDVAGANYSVALSQLAQAAQLSEDQPYQVITIEPSHPFLADLAQGKLSLLTGKITHEFQIDSSMHSELSGKLLYLGL